MSIRVSKQGMRIETLRSFSDQLHEEAMEDEKAIDFDSIGLYLAGLQVVFAIVCCGSASVLCCWLMPAGAVSAVRTLAITATLGMLLVRTPLRIGKTRGVVTVFNALRPSIAIYILALVLEQLVHTCVARDEADGEGHGYLRRAVYHGISALLIVSGFIRAKNPRSESDLPFLLTMICLLVIAVLPPPAMARSGPLCEPTSLLGAGERVLRALLFACVYVVLVYSAAPNRNISNELFICVARATAASIWVLGASAWALPLAPVQVATALFTRLHESNASPGDTASLPYYGSETLPLTARGAQTPLDGQSDVELGDIGVAPADPESLKAALAAHRATAGTGSPTQGAGPLTFSIPRSCQPSATLNGVNLAAVIARESHQEFGGANGV